MDSSFVSTFLEKTTPIFSDLPPEARDWLTQLPWAQRRYILSLCHLVCTTSADQQAQFLDTYTAEGLLSHIADDPDTKQRVNEHLRRFGCSTQLSDETIRRYIRHVYVQSMQENEQQRPELYLETVLMSMGNVRKRSSLLCYILGFEVLKLFSSMSWAQHERLCNLQVDQEDFSRTYLQPIQRSHKRHNIVVPKDENDFFARRDYYIKVPKVSPQQLTNLVGEAFSADSIIELGFSILRHQNAIHFDFDYIYNSAQGSEVSEHPTLPLAN